ncbi:HPr family phosphocarrier protein [Bacillus sp. OTU530]|uniref:HPr family phosphocarrier protein n=1 Tax=Bacillus sp. OTU530 TaxID=3043862 RepID=UPI00313AF141
MIKKKIIIRLKQGLQARNAFQFVQKASSFNSEINIIKNDKSFEAKSIMGVMVAVIRTGEEITVTTNGIDEQEAIGALEDFLSSKE